MAWLVKKILSIDSTKEDIFQKVYLEKEYHKAY